MHKQVKIVECPRDTMQGIPEFIPTDKKIDYLNTLLKVGFHTLDFGSFVSPKAIPQLKDTGEVVRNLDLSGTNTELLAIIGNERGAINASEHPQIKYLGFPFSISETFLKKNINSSVEDAYQRLLSIQKICKEHSKKLVVYISMAFGNPYGDEWSIDIINHWAGKLNDEEVEIVSLADTVGVGSPKTIEEVFSNCFNNFPSIEWGIHLHTTTQLWEEKLDAAYQAGCRRFDAVHNGLGGCPMAGHELVGNVNTRDLIAFLQKKDEALDLDITMLKKADTLAVHFFTSN